MTPKQDRAGLKGLAHSCLLSPLDLGTLRSPLLAVPSGLQVALSADLSLLHAFSEAESCELSTNARESQTPTELAGSPFSVIARLPHWASPRNPPPQSASQ